jgi:predicted AAA+ superfamily ATPase
LHKVARYDLVGKRLFEIGDKFYFENLGIRNAIINDFSPFEVRKDKGNLFENFIINEFMKQNEYQERFEKMYFWRTHEQQEIDLIIDIVGRYCAIIYFDILHLFL